MRSASGGGAAGRRDVGARRGAGGRLDSCLRRNDGRAAQKRLGRRTRRDTRGERGYDGSKGARVRRRREAAWVGRRDVGARRGAGGRLDSCLRRNDGGRRRRGLGAVLGEIPAAGRGYDGGGGARVWREWTRPHAKPPAYHHLPKPDHAPLPSYQQRAPSYPRSPRVSRRSSTQARSRTPPRAHPLPVIPAQAGTHAVRATRLCAERPAAAWRAVGTLSRAGALVVAWIPACAGMTDEGRERGLGAEHSEIPAASAGMTVEGARGCGEVEGARASAVWRREAAWVQNPARYPRRGAGMTVEGRARV